MGRYTTWYENSKTKTEIGMNNETETNTYEVSGWIETQISVKIEASSHEEAEDEFYKR